MKILHIGLMATGGKGLDKALKEKASEYFAISTSDPDLVSKALEFDYDLCFLQIQSEKLNGQNTVEVLRPIVRKGFTINWNGDIRNATPKWMLELDVDVLAFSNQRDVDYARTSNRRAEFLQKDRDWETFSYYRP